MSGPDRVIALDRDAGRDWMTHALCRGQDADLWFPNAGQPPSWALALCYRCPVREQCADYADAHNERHGVWGGMTTEQRLNRARIREAVA